MKNLKIAVLALFATATVSAQDVMTNQIPQSIMDNFQKTYPNATDVEWEMDGMNYQVEFDLENMDNEIWYSKDGNIVKSEMETTENELPSAVASTIKSKYGKYKIDEVEVTEENGKKTYEVELDKWFAKDKKVILAENGNVLSEE
ncbi:PepSY-like domain-containing protein [Luteirhabdus pelagi]|uniref:PepSY-like domain-containing protein n=1 Tax=Luteirhabdus pelagi TaxID=2792783 RepID=UPI00193A21DE|nr:PepSY-like domain-containing protein [Luteirhabdus pelagi]